MVIVDNNCDLDYLIIITKKLLVCRICLIQFRVIDDFSFCKILSKFLNIEKVKPLKNYKNYEII